LACIFIHYTSIARKEFQGFGDFPGVPLILGLFCAVLDFYQRDGFIWGVRTRNPSPKYNHDSLHWLPIKNTNSLCWRPIGQSLFKIWLTILHRILCEIGQHISARCTLLTPASIPPEQISLVGRTMGKLWHSVIDGWLWRVGWLKLNLMVIA